MLSDKGWLLAIELDVLTGHPDHDLLFVATQVARAAGLKSPGTGTSPSTAQPLDSKRS